MAAFLADVQDLRCGRVGDVDREHVVGRRRGRPEGVAVGGEAGLVTEQRHPALGHGREPGGQDLRLAAVLGDVVDVEQARVGGERAGDRSQDAALLGDDQRLVWLEHGGGDQPCGLHGVRRVAHVQDDDPALDVTDVGREEQRRVVVGALVAGVVDVAVDLEPADRAEGRDLVDGLAAVRTDQFGVAGEALGGPSAVVVVLRHLALQSGLRTVVGSALGLWRRRQWRFLTDRRGRQGRQGEQGRTGDGGDRGKQVQAHG